MTQSKPTPAALEGRETHPWSFIAEELLARGWTVEDLAFRMTVGDYDKFERDIQVNKLALDLYRHVGPTDVRCTLGKRSLERLSEAFGVSAELFTNLERAWKDGLTARAASEEAGRG